MIELKFSIDFNLDISRIREPRELLDMFPLFYSIAM